MFSCGSSQFFQVVHAQFRVHPSGERWPNSRHSQETSNTLRILVSQFIEKRDVTGLQQLFEVFDLIQ